MSKFSTNVPPMTERFSEAFGKRLIGRTDMEDALKKLDRLTQEEVGMAVAQNLKATHVVDERVRGVARTTSPNSSVLTIEPHASFQEPSCARSSTDGSLRQIRRLTITSRVILSTRKSQPGSFKAACSANGNQQARCSGFTANVRTVPPLTRYPLMIA